MVVVIVVEGDVGDCVNVLNMPVTQPFSPVPMTNTSPPLMREFATLRLPVDAPTPLASWRGLAAELPAAATVPWLPAVRTATRVEGGGAGPWLGVRE